LPELIAADEAAYVDLAVGLAGDTSRLRTIRGELRQKMSASRVMDFAAFARDMEEAYRAMWRKWCAARSATG
jgi:protein O-GlcNAc transferase